MSAFLKIIVSIVLISLILVSFWIFNYQPKQNEITKLDRDIAEKTAQYKELEVEAQNLERWEEARKEYQAILEKLHQTASAKDFIPSFLKDIEAVVKEERVSAADPSFQVTSITPGVVQENDMSTPNKPGESNNKASSSQPAVSQGGKTAVQLNFNGRFNTLVDFLQQLGNFKLNKLVTIEKITLTPQASTSGGSPVLTVTMPFDLYMLGGG